MDPEKDRESHKQTEKSELRLEKLITDGTQLITNVAAAGDSKEVLRRQEDEESRKARCVCVCVCIRLYMYSIT